MHTLWNLFILTLTIFAVAQFLPKIHLKNFFTAILVAIVYSVINFFIGWLLVILSFPLMIITFGLFTFVINAFLLWITDLLIEDFKIEDLGTTFLAAFIITIVSALLKYVF